MAAHVAVLMGGLSSEREVSLVSGVAVVKALKALGYKVTEIDVGKDVAEAVAKAKPDVVFNALHGTYGEDGCVQGVLEVLGIPYTHSGVLASGLAFDKQVAKKIFECSGIVCPPGKVLHRDDVLKGDVMERPYVIKPVSDGSSVGVYIVKQGDELALSKEDLERHERFLVEKYIEGKELSVAVTDEQPLGVVELRPKKGFYDYRHKYEDGMTEHILPAQIDSDIYDEVMLTAFRAHKLLGCRGISRADFRYDYMGDQQFYLLEVNTHPGFTPLSLVPEMAEHKGITFENLVEYLIKTARCEK